MSSSQTAAMALAGLLRAGVAPRLGVALDQAMRCRALGQQGAEHHSQARDQLCEDELIDHA